MKPPFLSPTDNRSPGCSAGQFHQNERHRGLGIHQGGGDGRHSCSTCFWKCQIGFKQSEFPLCLNCLLRNNFNLYNDVALRCFLVTQYRQ